ncbi:hypothetical protein MC7420_6592 [Coleofasciculus chthonoplastes PCC 7420]|uniref:Type I restriction enzyme R protein N terminal domain protein n=1 Tax=Coleofasciculus chthonoplastes PCC 7420 TaxID=118168 RepID=B4W466_9CYAN|nr:hypothetical protein [Coleofasciculus chthonoplastes]EDX70992.1 hypothetical protein MC7420_6592 [Coleofasciculus chthonoplastes PCC 7420]
MSKARILDPSESYTFSKYAQLAYDTADILAEFGVTLKNSSLQLPQQLPIDLEPLRIELQENLMLVDLVSEIARREALIFPILKTICKFIQVPLKIEYPVRVSNWLKGSFDYFISTPQNLLVIEAKNADLARGFTQLAVELIALDQWTDSTVPMLYGSVTTGDTWKFGIFQRQEKIIHKDINTYAIPSDLNWVLSTLFGISLS